MPRIETIKSHYKKKEFCIVTFDDASESLVHLDIILKFSLKKGSDISNRILKIIIAENDLIVAKRTAYYYASYKPRTYKQVRDRLKKESLSDEIISTAIEFLKEFNLLDDRNYAEMLIKEFTERKNASKFKIKNELFKRGIDKEISEEFIEKYYPHDNENDLALDSARKKMRMISHKPKEKHLQLLINHLQREGFNWDIIKSIIAGFKSEGILDE